MILLKDFLSWREESYELEIAVLDPWGHCFPALVEFFALCASPRFGTDNNPKR